MITEIRDEHGWTRTEREEMINKARELLKQAKDFNITTNKKIEHTWKCSEIQKLYYTCMEVNKYLFDPEYSSEYNRYAQGIKYKETKKNLDHYLYMCKKRIIQELIETINIHVSILTGEGVYNRDLSVREPHTML